MTMQHKVSRRGALATLTAALARGWPALAQPGPRDLRIDRDALAERSIPVFGTAGEPARESACEQTWALGFVCDDVLEAFSRGVTERLTHWLENRP